MKVLHLSTIDRGGGAIRATNDLHESLCALGVTSKILVKLKLGNSPTVIDSLDGRPGRLSALWRRLAGPLDQWPTRLLKTPNSSGLSPAWVPDAVASGVNGSTFDIVNLHWICEGFVRPSTLPRLRKPLVWTSYDMWPICGAEHYAGDTTRYVDGYTRENRPPDEWGFDLNRWVWRRKRAAWTHLDDVTVVVATRWLADCFRRSALFSGRRIEIISHGVDPYVFKPVDRAFARQVLNLPPDRKLILFGAMGGTSTPRKGFHSLIPALKRLADPDFVAKTNLVVFGTSVPNSDLELGLEVTYLGMLDKFSLALAYAAADVFVAPSTEDNLPLTVLEALACGTPVIAFDIGGMLDVMEHERTGYLARSFDVGDLANGIDWVLADDDRRMRLGATGRERIENGFTLQHQARSYIRLYEDILDRTAR